MQASRRERVTPYTGWVGTEALGQPELPLNELLNHFDAGHDPLGVVEAFEPQHRRHVGLDAPMVLFDDVIQLVLVQISIFGPISQASDAISPSRALKNWRSAG